MPSNNAGAWPFRAVFLAYLGFRILLLLGVVPIAASIAMVLNTALPVAIAVVAYLFAKKAGLNAAAWTAAVLIAFFAVRFIAVPLTFLQPMVLAWVLFVLGNSPVILLLFVGKIRKTEHAESTFASSEAPSMLSAGPTGGRPAAAPEPGKRAGSDTAALSQLAKEVAMKMYEEKTGQPCCRVCGRSLKPMQSGVYAGGSGFFDMLSDVPYNCKSCGAPFCVDCMTKLRKGSGSGACPKCGGDIGW
jgi:hypothetical protein